jgi:hypothetical protein
MERTLYDGAVNGPAARYTIEDHDEDHDETGRIALRVYNVAHGDALVFLTPGGARQLAADLEQFAATPRAEPGTVSISEIEAVERAMTPGEWEVWTSNSHRRVTRIDGPDGCVLRGSIQQHDGHPDLSGLNRDNDLAGMCAARKALPVLIRIAKAALVWSEQRASNIIGALTKTDEEFEAESADSRRARSKRMTDLARAIEIALKQVRA